MRWIFGVLVCVGLGFIGLSMANTAPVGAALHSTPNPSLTPDVAPIQDDPTFYADIEPILAQHCMGCHAAGGIGNTALAMEDPFTIQEHAREIAYVTAIRYMPPWMPGEKSPEFLHERKLTDDEIALITTWYQDGAPMGDVAERHTHAVNWPTLREDVVLTMPEPYTPTSELDDDYRCFLLDPQFTEDTYVIGSTVVPGQTRLVHHVIAYQVSGTLYEAALAKDAEDDRPGWACYGGPGVTGGNARPQLDREAIVEALQAEGVNIIQLARDLNLTSPSDQREVDLNQLRQALERQGFDFNEIADSLEAQGLLSFDGGMGLAGSVGSWVPGSVPTLHPEGTGVFVQAGTVVVLQVHYNLSAPPAPDQTTLILQLAESNKDMTALVGMSLVAPVEIACADGFTGEACDRNVAVQAVANPLLPDGLLARCNKTLADYANQIGNFARSSCDRVVNRTGEIVQVGGHMHQRGQSIQVILNPDTPHATVLIEIPSWDFHWQGTYQLATPIPVQVGDVIRLTCTWEKADRYIVWGEGTQDEMCLNTVLIRPE